MRDRLSGGGATRLIGGRVADEVSTADDAFGLSVDMLLDRRCPPVAPDGY